MWPVQMHIISTVVKKPSLISRNLSEKTIYDIESYTFNSRLLLVPVDLWPATSDSFLNTTWHFSMSRDTKQNNFFILSSEYKVDLLDSLTAVWLFLFASYSVISWFFIFIRFLFQVTFPLKNLTNLRGAIYLLFCFPHLKKAGQPNPVFLGFFFLTNLRGAIYLLFFFSLTWRKLVNQVQFFLDFRDATFWHT